MVSVLCRSLPGWWCFYKNGPSSASFSFILSFQTNNTIFTTNKCEKMLWPTSIQCRDLNPRPSVHEFPPITTRPGLPPHGWWCLHDEKYKYVFMIWSLIPYFGESLICPWFILSFYFLVKAFCIFIRIQI